MEPNFERQHHKMLILMDLAAGRWGTLAIPGAQDRREI
jgi:hypothetical protein